MWLPLEVAIIYRRTAGTGRQVLLTRRSAAILVGALELSVIIGALTSGALVESTSMTFLLALPAIVVTLCFFVIWFGIEDAPGTSDGGIDWPGLGLITVVLGLVMGGLIAVRLTGPGSFLPWLLIVAGLAALLPFVRYENAHPEPLIDVRLLAARGQWPVQLTAFLFGMSVLGAQIPLSTFARTDPAEAGYGLGADAAFVSTLIGVYVVFLAIGALHPAADRPAVRRPRRAGRGGSAGRPSATRCGCRSTTPRPRRWSTWPSPASAPAPSSPPSPPPPPRPRHPSAPASPPA